MTFSQIDNFIAVAEAGSFSAAAETLYISPQALIQQIAKMEQELGFKLLLRSSKGVRLSAAGEEYYHGVKRLLSEYRRCTERAAKKAQRPSVLRVGLPDNINSAFMLSICRQFTEKHPGIKLRFENYSIENTVKAITQGRVDICAQIKTGDDSAFFSQKLFPVRHFCMVSRNSALCSRQSLGIKDLVGCTLGVWGPLSTYRKLAAYISEHGLDIRLHSLPENFSEALIFCVEGNPLLACAPLIDYLKGSLEVVPFDFDCGVDYYLSYLNADNEAVQLFLAIAKETAASESHPWRLTLQNFSIDK